MVSAERKDETVKDAVAGFLLLAFVIFGMRQAAEVYTCGAGWNAYTLTTDHVNVSFEFQPGYAGDHRLKVTYEHPGSRVLTQIDWSSNDYPSWHRFVEATTEGEYELYTGSGDVRFRVTFTRDPSSATDEQVRWQYRLD